MSAVLFKFYKGTLSVSYYCLGCVITKQEKQKAAVECTKHMFSFMVVHMSFMDEKNLFALVVSKLLKFRS